MAQKQKEKLYGEQDLRSLFDAAPDATLLVNADGRIERVNVQAETLFGYRHEELLDQPIELLVPQRYRNTHIQHRNDFASKPILRAMGSSLELYARRKDGSEFPIDVNLSPISLQGRNIVSASVRDITDRKRTSSKLAEMVEVLRSEKEFSENLITTLQGIVLNLDSEGRITLVNRYFERLTGYTADQIIGRDWFETFIPESERPTIKALFFDVLRSRTSQGYVSAIVTKSGEQRMIQWFSKTIENTDGSFAGLLNTGFDVTEEEAAARELRDAKEEADRATAIKTRFLAAASHDLRQPLQSVGLYLALLTRLQQDSKGRDIGNKMKQSLDSMGDILDALLDISKLDSGSVVADPREFPLQQLLNQIAADNLPLAEEKNLFLDIEPTTLIVRSDPALLQRVIENFVGNALRYTETGGVRVACREDGNSVKIDVIDTGLGIREDALKTIFEEYFQLDNPIRDRSKGLGLGLAIVKHIARLLDHELVVKSAPGQGSTFSAIVPQVGFVGDAEAVTPLPDEKGTTDDVAMVLVVDDDPSIVDATRMLLEIEGYNVQTALHGDAALAKVANGLRPDAIVSDYRLPGLNGLEVVHRIREMAGDDLPTVLLTGDTSASEILDAGLTRCTVMHKPIKGERLISLIREYCGNPAN